MKRVLKDLKPYSLVIVFILAILFVQAMADLSLPDYMSKIVNIGIQQQGIEDPVPKAMTEKEYERLKMFVKEKDLEIFSTSYRFLDRDDLKEEDKNLVERYPYLKDGNIYVLEDLGEEGYSRLKDVILNPILTSMFLSSKEVETTELGNMIGNLPEGVDIFMAIEKMPEEDKSLMLKSIDEEIDKLPDMYSEQGAIRYVHQQYTSLGLDMDKMQIDYIIKIGIKMLLLSLLIMFAAISGAALANRVAAGFARNLRESVFKKVMEFSNEEFNNFSTASLITRSTNDIQQIQQVTLMFLRIVFFAPILGIGGVIKVLNTNVSMAWIVGLGLVIILIFIGILFTFVTPKFKISQKLVDKLNLVTRESLTGMLVIRAFNNEEHEEDKFEKVNRDLTGVGLSISKFMIVMQPGMQLLMNLMMILILWVGAKQIDQAAIQVGDMMAFMQYAMQIIMSFLMISVIAIFLPRATVAMQRIGEMLNQEIYIKDEKDSKPLKDTKGLLEFKNVGFKYPLAEESILEDINFRAEPGKMTAFIGSTGSGKSSIVNLVPRLFDVSQGSITLDGQDIRGIRIKDLREQIGYVAQKSMLFSGDIESNLRFGKNQEVSLQDIDQAIDISNSREFVDNYETGINTAITQGGTNVSGGQRQRLSIARAIVARPQILVFDDSFSALDFKTDREVRNALKESMGNTTMLVVAQRINTIKYADNIIVLDKGRIVGEGSHKELLRTCKVYQQIAMSQLSEEELNYE